MATELREALSQIAEIRLQLARAEVYRGYRAVPVAISGLLAIVAAATQAVWIPDPLARPDDYLMLWLGTAVLAGLIPGASILVHRLLSDSELSRETARLAAEPFLPTLMAGGLMTLVLAWPGESTHDLELLPGLWQIFFSLGIYGSSRNLPRAVIMVAAFYMCTGLACLAWARGPHALSPWAMGAPFTVGQLMAAAILYWTLERGHESTRVGH